MADELENGCLDWDSEINDDGQDYVTLPEGDYNFFVEKVEKGRFPGSAKIPPCNKATLTLRVQTDDGRIAYAFPDLILYTTLEWKLSSFFRSIGQKKHGEKLVMNWNNVEGSIGRAHFKPRSYTNKNGDERTVNDVDKYLDWDDKYAAETPSGGFTEITTDDTTDLPF